MFGTTAHPSNDGDGRSTRHRPRQRVRFAGPPISSVPRILTLTAGRPAEAAQYVLRLDRVS